MFLVREILQLVLAAVAVSSPLLLSAGPALAAPALAGAAASTTVSRSGDDVCEAARQATHAPGACATENRIGVTAARPLTAAELAEYGPLAAADGTTVAEAARRGTVYIRGWYQEQHGLYYVNWKERHEGKFLYNGSIAWVNNAHGYVGGYHRCGLGYGIGYEIDNLYCSEYGESTSVVDNYDGYKVHVLVKAIPIYATHHMDAYTHGNGSVS